MLLEMKPPSQNGAEDESAIAGAIDRLWLRFFPEIKNRVTALETAAQAANANQLTASQRETARTAAHKLAGVLGTFGLTRGTALARELEQTLSSEDAGTDDSSTRLAMAVAELSAIVESRHSAR
jgi:HPt (histidine-containing phosphotransfer) domain-containing protein